MSLIENVEIFGFWGDHDIALKFFPDINFLIGPNGSGKTTVINTIAAALTGDFATLDRLPFRSIRITLFDPITRRKPSVEVLKKQHERIPFPSIDYIIKPMASAAAQHYSLNQFEEQRSYRDYPTRYYYTSRAVHRRVFADISERLKALAPTSWLSIHRATGPSRYREERSYEFTVDQKLDDISDLLVRYFSELEKRSAEETHRFQETIFLSLLHRPTPSVIFQRVKDLDLEREQNALIQIFEKFQVPRSRYIKATDRHFKDITKAIKDREEADIFPFDDVLLFISSWRIHSVIQEWNELLSRQQNIFRPRDNFLKILNSMLLGKKLQINERNEICAVTRSEKILSPKELSSGEKQLLIIMGEALLQRSAQWIYIADEPELSLHVNWQVALADNIRSMNPAAQIIMATHSPDIVSHYPDRIHNMEEIVL